ncbi:hypothetical protein K402DRAFT_156752 [Aulographum hederae CBS 113979]|uniref:G-protein coupled receptors family 1 profile domain-containing protein n=1 Tax=Aulographum hederae CBS 113979 TaxID=1176131 RepID=A0A6G1GSS2_9PEZI|nr:hypothetical protein K402DRAFT_156752 [Aulographum hederae CBS 113979]
MVDAENVPATITRLSPVLRDGLTAITVLAFLSYLASFSLLVILSYRLVKLGRNGRHANQFTILIFNLLLADLQQATSFVISAHWLARNGIFNDSDYCWAQGWFVSNGDLASGVFCLAIGIHTFASVIFNYRLGWKTFCAVVIGLWVGIYACSSIGIVLHGRELYVRAGAWCWIDARFYYLRFLSHYLFIFLAEFGTILIYLAMYLTTLYRVRSGYYYDSAVTKQARRAMNLMAVYPAVYVACTIPLASARMASMNHQGVSELTLVIAGALITSNGWLDVLLYVCTRRIMLFSDDTLEEGKDGKGGGFETFTLPWSGSGDSNGPFGTTTTISAAIDLNKKGRRLSRSHVHGKKSQSGKSKNPFTTHTTSSSSTSTSTEDLANAISFSSPSSSRSPSTPSSSSLSPRNKSVGENIYIMPGVNRKTVVEVRSEPMEFGDVEAVEISRRASRVAPGAAGGQQGMELEFQTAPAGWKS